MRIWDPVAGQSLAVLVGHNGDVRNLAFSPDGAWSASGDADRTVRIWKVATGKEIYLLPHENAVQSVAFSRDGKHVASAGRDMPIRIWDTTTYVESSPLGDNGIDVICIAFSPDGKRLASGRAEPRGLSPAAGFGWAKPPLSLEAFRIELCRLHALKSPLGKAI
jgi:WD40 repeat protein